MTGTSVALAELTGRFGGEIVGDPAFSVTGLAPLESAGSTQLSFLANAKYLEQAAQTRAGAVLLSAADLAKLAECGTRSYIVTRNPYAYFARVAQFFVERASPALLPGIAPGAVIDPAAAVAPSARIGPHAVIEAGAVIGAHARLDAHVYIGRDTHVGEGTHLYPNASVYDSCVLGARVIVHAGAVLGADGFGFAPDFDAGEGEWVKIPQVGSVRVGDDVEIGANSTIDRGALGDTVIEQGVKIDNLVHIGHNCHIGAYTVIAGCTGIAGSTTIGRHCMIGGAVGIAGHVTLGDYVIVTAKSGVSKSLPKAGVYTSAFPAIDNADWNRNAVLMRNLNKMRERIKKLEAAFVAQQTPRA